MNQRTNTNCDCLTCNLAKLNERQRLEIVRLRARVAELEAFQLKIINEYRVS